MLYELWQQVFDGKKGELIKSHWLKVADGQPWMKAKAQRNTARPVRLEIRPARPLQDVA